VNDSVAMYVDRNGITTVVVMKPPAERENIDKIIAFCQASGAITSKVEGVNEERYIIDFSNIPGLEYLGGCDEFSRDELYNLLSDLVDTNRPVANNTGPDELTMAFADVEPLSEDYLD